MSASVLIVLPLSGGAIEDSCCLSLLRGSLFQNIRLLYMSILDITLDTRLVN